MGLYRLIGGGLKQPAGGLVHFFYRANAYIGEAGVWQPVAYIGKSKTRSSAFVTQVAEHDPSRYVTDSCKQPAAYRFVKGTGGTVAAPHIVIGIELCLAGKLVGMSEIVSAVGDEFAKAGVIGRLVGLIGKQACRKAVERLAECTRKRIVFGV